MPDDDVNPAELTPAEMDDCELLISRSTVRNTIIRQLGNVSPELAERYHMLNDEVDRRIRGLWS